VCSQCEGLWEQQLFFYLLDASFHFKSKAALQLSFANKIIPEMLCKKVIMIFKSSLLVCQFKNSLQNNMDYTCI